MKRDSLVSLFEHIHPGYVPETSARISFTFCLGGLATTMFLAEILTGALLMLYYYPSISSAYPSVQRIMYFAPYGFVFRNIHYWAGQLLVILVLLHMVRVFLTGSYLPPRQLNWVIGAILLLFVFVEDFTGYLLIWDERALWAWTIARNLTDRIPFFGKEFALVLFGPPDVSDLSLVRLYAWHVLILPAIMFFMMSLHYWKIRREGGISIPL
ncbi:MAG: cytochrome b N-terminal domain-containing protein [Deltaproteobacteria bacterium]|nr:cytochrome b N-terminal domain-containing protein [Deltaproteobacteria bacterium]